MCAARLRASSHANDRKRRTGCGNRSFATCAVRRQCVVDTEIRSGARNTVHTGDAHMDLDRADILGRSSAAVQYVVELGGLARSVAPPQPDDRVRRRATSQPTRPRDLMRRRARPPSSARCTWSWVVALIIGFGGAWILELWLFVVALPAAVVRVGHDRFVMRSRWLPAVLAVDATAAVDGDARPERSAAIRLAAAARGRRDTLVAAVARLERRPDITGSRAAAMRLDHGCRLLDETPLSELRSRLGVRLGLLGICVAVTAGLLWVAPTSRWWLLPLTVSFAGLTFAVDAVVERTARPSLLAEAALASLYQRIDTSPHALAVRAGERRAVLRHAQAFIANADLPPHIARAASERLHEAAATIAGRTHDVGHDGA